MNRHRLTLLILLACLCPIGCERSEPPVILASAPADAAQALPTIKAAIGNRTFDLEVALSPAQQNKGLMFRDSMPADHGMIFVFTDETPRAFWMKNTHIPLDILYLDAHGKVVSIKSMKAYDLTSVSSEAPAMYAIELNVNTTAAVAVHTGDLIALPAFSAPDTH